MKFTSVFKSVLVGVPIGITLFDTVGYVARVDGVSMQPALNPNNITDYVYLNRWTIRDLKIDRGDIVSLVSPKDPKIKIIKRVVGIQGDIILTRGYKNQIVRVPEGHCWVEGDHVGHSMDSNLFGPVSLGLVTAKATCIVWPPSRWQNIYQLLPEERKPLNLKDNETIKFDFSGPVARNGLALGDVDNDGNYELVVGNEAGDISIFKGVELWQTIHGLGFVSCIVIGDILNRKQNCLIVISADGWVHIYCCLKNMSNDSDIIEQGHIPAEVDTVDGLVYSTQKLNVSKEKINKNAQDVFDNDKLECIHIQRIPANSKVALLGDVDGDGSIELVLGLTDRVVRSYRWVSSPQFVSSPDVDLQKDIKSQYNISGRLVGLNKWECANQIGSVTLHHSSDGTPCLLVAQPGGTFMRIKCQPDDFFGQSANNFNNSENSSENIAASFVDYQFLGLSRMRNQNISTEILGDLKIIENTNKTVPSRNSSTESTESQIGESETKNTKLKGNPYAVCTLDGTIMLVEDEIILWAIQVDHQTFALSKLDVTGNGADDIIVCSWDGQTYILDQDKNSVRFQLDEPVQAFCSGFYNLVPGESTVPCLVYMTFWNKIYIYFDIKLDSLISKRFNPDLSKLEKVEPLVKKINETENLLTSSRRTKQKLVQYLLYGLKMPK